ncbi:hypothetical protein ACUODJ_26360, partial [Escherichia sp. HC-CC]
YCDRAPEYWFAPSVVRELINTTGDYAHIAE